MTDNGAAAHSVPADGSLTIKLQRDKDGQFFDLPKGWKFTNNQVTAHLAAGALVLMPHRPGKLKLPASCPPGFRLSEKIDQNIGPKSACSPINKCVSSYQINSYYRSQLTLTTCLGTMHIEQSSSRSHIMIINYSMSSTDAPLKDTKT